MPPAEAAKSERRVSIRADVYVPLDDKRGVIARVPKGVTCTLVGDFVYISASLFPQFGGASTTGYLVPRSKTQFSDEEKLRRGRNSNSSCQVN